MVWENVPGAFSSNGGEDFRTVLEETTKIADKSVSIPRPPGGKWANAGCIMGNGYSLAWRVHDAQYWGVPQRRRRISLVADFGGESAPEILFEPDSVRGDITESGAAGQETAAGTGGGIDKPNVICNGHPGDIARSITARGDGSPDIDKGPNIVYCLQGNGIDRANTAGCNGKGWRENECYTLNTIDRPAVYDARGNGDGNTVPTMTGDHNGRISDYTAVCIGNGQADQTKLSDKVGALNCMHDQQAVITAVTIGFDNQNNANYNLQSTLRAHTSGGFGDNVLHHTVRRLTPIECERLQGYSDGWTNIGEWTDTKGKKHKPADAPRYKALGNSIALPFWEWLAGRIVAQYDKPPTMASLFDGIGGFPLVFSRVGAVPVWASEIEEFPMAVTKIHFPEEEK